MSTPARSRVLAGMTAVLLAGQAVGHGLLVSILGQGDYVVGRVYYSNGEIGAGQYTELTDLDAPATKPQTGKTDAEGRFRFRGVPGHHYRFLTEGEEGHTTEMRITLAEGAKGKFIDRDAVAPGWRALPAWLVLGTGIVVVTGIAAWRRRRSA